jgi:hypothetical protein
MKPFFTGEELSSIEIKKYDKKRRIFHSNLEIIY